MNDQHEMTFGDPIESIPEDPSTFKPEVYQMMQKILGVNEVHEQPKNTKSTLSSCNHQHDLQKMVGNTLLIAISFLILKSPQVTNMVKKMSSKYYIQETILFVGFSLITYSALKYA